MGHKIEEALGEEAVLAMLDQCRADLLLVSSDSAEDLDPIHLLGQVRRKYPKLPVLMFTSEPRADRAREVMLRGATSVLRFPMPANQFRAVVSQALEDVEPVRRTLEKGDDGVSKGDSGSGGRSLKSGLSSSNVPAQASSGALILGADPMLRLAVELTDAIAPTRVPLLIQGERGTGKSLLARRLHQQSPGSGGPFVEVSCRETKGSSVAVNLFGQCGPGGSNERMGFIAQACGGTLVLNEVGELSPELQGRLLELLREGTYQAVDSDLRRSSDCRIVVTNREDLAPQIEEGSFRSDLYRLMSLVSLTLPSLRKRRGDIAVLAENFRDQFARQHGKPARGFSADSISHLVEHPWPGNVAELRDAVERAVLVSRDKLIQPGHLALATASSGSAAPVVDPRRVRKIHAEERGILPLKEALEGPEKQLILAALEALNWNRQETARVLDINRTTLYKKMKKYGLIFDEPVWVN